MIRFSGANARIESSLVEIKVALEEILYRGLWIPMVSSVDSKNQANRGYRILREAMGKRKRVPSLKECRQLFSLEVTQVFMKDLGISDQDRQWVLRDLSNLAEGLIKPRNRAVHWSEDWDSKVVEKILDKYFGVNELGVIPRLASLFFRSE
jgi:hypothetical protein